jgi:CubicO group peptidase (beta-lactamase class C family)
LAESCSFSRLLRREKAGLGNGDFWWSGYYGTTFFVSPETGLVGVVLAQNEPVVPHSPLPYAGYVAQALAYYGL